MGENCSLEIHTERLTLIALTAGQLGLYLADPQQLERELGFPISRPIVTDPVRRAIGMKLSKMAEAEERDHPWYTYWLIVVAVAGEPFGAGMAGFKGCPDSDGEVEIGYGIDPDCRDRGYTTEAAQALIAWAFQDPRCVAVIAPDTLKTNVASNRVLEKVGMRIYVETDEALFWRIDREDLTSDVE
jgi:ribosomal-protein-alanine N-acetyltransferase